MAIKFDSGAVSQLLQKAKDAGMSAAESVEKGAIALSERVKDAGFQERLKKYAPLFPEEYTAAAFVLPRLITVVDESVRRGIDVCEGSVGWRSVEAETEILHLYSTAAEMKEIEFYPAVTVGATYYVDAFNSSRYIDVDCIFQKAHEERLAELEQIAFSLGAKSCTIEITETQQDSSSTKSGGNMGVGKLGFKADKADNTASSQMRSGKITITFKTSAAPQRPALKWFANDETIKNLIEIRCADPGRFTHKELLLSGSTFATMSHNTAAAIDGLRGVKGGFSMKNQATQERSSLLIFSVAFE
ncbi:MAG: hypothetical protein IJN60_05650 [Oscillospiraceae bacterium]|nr:hypothetical protein [Oscillospiraceae bacterium]